MSAGYASRLKEYPNKGVCGLPESIETPRTYQVKRQRLATLVRQHKGRIAVLTGAGISTSAGIPDFRGPKGIWTLEQKQKQSQKKTGRKRQRTEATAKQTAATSTTTKTSMDFSRAQPTLTHCAIRHLINENVLSFVVTQNVDGLHQRSGLSRNKLAVLHGCVFTEKCQACGLEHFCDQECGGMSFQPTKGSCVDCEQPLRDTLLDWRDPLPHDDWERSQIKCQEASLILCLGTSLRIEPAASLCQELGPRQDKPCYVIVNLQETPYDDGATLIIRARVDQVLQDLVKDLSLSGDEDSSSDSDSSNDSETRESKSKDASTSASGVAWNEPVPPGQVERLWRNEAATAEYRANWWDMEYRERLDEEEE